MNEVSCRVFEIFERPLAAKGVAAEAMEGAGAVTSRPRVSPMWVVSRATTAAARPVWAISATRVRAEGR